MQTYFIRENLRPRKGGDGNGRIVDKTRRIVHWVSKHDGTSGTFDGIPETSRPERIHPLYCSPEAVELPGSTWPVCSEDPM